MDADFGLEDKTILITGATSGIGLECARVFAESGAKLALCGRNSARLEGLRAEFPQAAVFGLDIARGDLEDFAGALPALDGAVLAAGIDARAPLKFLSEESAEEILRTNLVANIKLAGIFARKRKINKGGSVVLLGSVAGFLADAGHLAYGVSKAGVLMLAKELAVEMAPRGIRVNAISPGLVKTPMTRKFIEENPGLAAADEKKYLLGYGEPRSVANAAQFLLSDASRWITGANIVADGGYSCQK